LILTFTDNSNVPECIFGLFCTFEGIPKGGERQKASGGWKKDDAAGYLLPPPPDNHDST
jgi:hypothetical protein